MQPKSGGLTSPDRDQAVDLSRPCIQNSDDRTEPDAIHRRLGSEDWGVQNLTKSVIELMENSPSGMKRKHSPTKCPQNQKETEETVKSQNMTIDNSVSSNGVADTSNLDCSTKAVKKNSDHGSTRLTNSSKNKKKNSQQAKRPAKKKKTTKKKYPIKDEDDFEIDPRLGGSKIRQSISNKNKDKKVKSHENQDAKKTRVCDQRNPYIHIEGSWNLPTIVKIVNGSAKEDDVEGKITAKLTKAAQYVDEEHRSKAAKVGFSSTLSDRYDTHNRDSTWVCVFCRHFTHMECLGDLYGPYYINQVTPASIWFSKKNPDTVKNLPEVEDQFNRATSPPRSAAKKSKKSPKKRTNVKEEPVCNESYAVSSGTIEVDVLSKSDEKMEVWFHESCLVWAPGVCLVPPRLVGLDEAVSDAQQAACEYCKKMGAHIFCRSRGCGKRTHFPCAVSQDWILQEETFLALCPLHSDQAATTC